MTLQIGVETVRTHARNIYRKLGVTSRRALVALPRPPAEPVTPPASGTPPHAPPRRLQSSQAATDAQLSGHSPAGCDRVHYRVMVTGTPPPMRRANQVMAPVLTRMQPCETAVPRRAGEVVGAVEGDLAWSTFELLQDIRSRTGGEGERAAGSEGGERDGLLDEEAAARGGCRGLAYDRRGTGAATRP